jgi:glycosyltransferase involved in cell wall biosynthesis
MPKEILIVTTGQPSTNPRMVKEYRALKKAGYKVKVLYSFWVDWALATDELFFQEPGIDRTDFILTGGSKNVDKVTYFLSRLIYKFCQAGSKWMPALFGNFTQARPTFFLQRAAKKHNADLYIGHNLGALPVVVNAAKHNNALCGFDVEDYHSGMHKSKGSRQYDIARNIEVKYLPQCGYVTFSSDPIANAYLHWLQNDNTAVVLNVPERDEIINTLQQLPAQPLKLVWFSQHIGAERGLETVINAMNSLPGCDIELHLLGNCTEMYKSHLYSLIAKRDKLTVYPPVYSKNLTDFLKDKHIGLAAEPGRDDNNDMAVSNKILSYLAAGNMILATDTTAQKAFIDHYPSVGKCYNKNDANSLANVLAEQYADPVRINKQRSAALAVAQTELNWDMEQKKLLDLVNKTMKNQPAIGNKSNIL